MAGKLFVKSFSKAIGWLLLVSLFATSSGVPVPLPVNRTGDMHRNASHNDWHIVEFCKSEGNCVKIDCNEVTTKYPNLFKKTGHKRPRTALNANEDSDTCCPTLRRFDKSRTRTNVNGVERVIFQSGSLRQWIPIGSCTKHKGHCQKCQIQNRTISILVVDYDQNDLKFDQFSIPLYCTCFDSRRRHLA